MLACIAGYKDGPASQVSARVVGFQDVKMKRSSFHGLTTTKSESPGNLKKVNDFLEGKSKRQHLFFFYQKPDVLNESGEYVDGPGEARLLVTSGEQERLKARGCYFLRTQAADKPVKVDVPSDGDLLFGEISAQPLESLNTGLGEVFLPIISSAARKDKEVKAGAQAKAFGLCDDEQKSEFTTGFGKFSLELNEAIRGLTGGIELKKLDGEYDLDPRVTTYHDIVKGHPEIVTHFETVLEEW